MGSVAEPDQPTPIASLAEGDLAVPSGQTMPRAPVDWERSEASAASVVLLVAAVPFSIVGLPCPALVMPGGQAP